MTKILMLINLFKWANAISFLKNLIPQGKRILIYTVIIAAVIGAGYYWHKSEIKHALEMQASVLAISHQQELNNLMAINLAATDELNKKNKENERKRNEEIRRINATHSTIVAGLRDRPTDRQPTVDSSSDTGETSPKVGATGLQLSAMDAGILARFARDTAELQSELTSCIADYNSVKESLDKLRGQNAAK